MVIVALALFGPTVTRAETPEDRAEVLGTEIDSLCVLGRYSEALERTRELLTLRQGEPKTKSYELVDAQWLLRTMELAVTLPDSVRAELAWADSAGLRGDDLWRRGLYSEGISACQRQLEVRRRILGEEHPDVATSLVNLGDMLWAKGDTAGVEPLLREALAMDRKLLGEEHPDVASSLESLGLLLQRKGDYAGAEPLFRESLAMMRKLLGEEHPSVAWFLGTLAGLLQDKGDYAGAEPLLRQALAMYRKLPGEEDQNVATTLNDLGNLLRDKGEYAGAEPLLRQALAMYRKLLGENHPVLATSLNNLGALLWAKGDYAGAEPLYRESLAMRRRLLGEEHPAVANSMNNLGTLLQNKGDYAGAEPLLREALAMRRKLWGEEHPDVAHTLNNLGTLLQNKGDYAGAEPLLREALAMNREVLGEEHPVVASNLRHLGRLFRANGDLSEAEAFLVQASAVYEAARLRIGSGIERSTFQNSPYPALAEVHLELGHPADAWPAAERELGRSLFDLLTTAKQRQLSPTEAAREDSLRWLLGDLGRQLDVYRNAARRDTTGQAARDVETTQTRLIETEAVWSTFRQEMSAKYPVTEGLAYPLERVQAALDSTTALAGWLDVEIRKNEVSRWGYVIHHDGPVIWERLSRPESRDDKGSSRADHGPPSLAALFRSALTDSTRIARGSAVDDVAGVPPAIKSEARGRTLFAERFAPLLSHLTGVRNLVVIPSGEMLGVPVEALPLDDGRPLGERFAVSYTPSATIYTWLREKDTDRRGWDESTAILLLGDPPFSDGQKSRMEKEIAEERDREKEKDNEKEKESPRPSSSTLASIPSAPDSLLQRSAVSGNPEALDLLPRLPATRQEVEDLSKLSQHSTVLLGPDASEQQLVAMARSGELGTYRLIHLATHAWVNPVLPEESSLFLSRVDLPDPLEAAEKGERIFDGRLTAKEILQEWKLDADLVTLSGCQTALGRRVTGEGYVGFAHAFLQAGARSLLVSLWPVEDKATSLLMQRFYGHLFGNARDDRGGQSDDRPVTKRDALQEAKRWLREYRDEDGNRPYTQPYYWGSFVLVGDPQ
jgi:CHAT domain-containing protein/tetratricopeptide (TPR) repeat protein